MSVRKIAFIDCLFVIYNQLLITSNSKDKVLIFLLEKKSETVESNRIIFLLNCLKQNDVSLIVKQKQIVVTVNITLF